MTAMSERDNDTTSEQEEEEGEKDADLKSTRKQCRVRRIKGALVYLVVQSHDLSVFDVDVMINRRGDVEVRVCVSLADSQQGCNLFLLSLILTFCCPPLTRS